MSKIIKKALIVSPYFKTLGGGERYALTFTQALLDKNWLVDVTIDDEKIIDSRKRFNLPLSSVNGVSVSNVKQNAYDLVFWVSDGSIPRMAGKLNLLHFQVPFHNVKGKNLLNKLKFRSINKIICNSFFTKNVIDKEYGIKSEVWYPPVSVEEFSPGKKQNIILSVGRFEKSMTEKRQDVLIKTFRQMIEQGLREWKLILSGGCSESGNQYLEELRRLAVDFPIEFKVNISFADLKKLYSEAKIFWHAAGFGVNEEKFPEKTEHFGMTTVEAMAGSCVPVVINKGGQKEIVVNNESGYLWQTEEELIRKTFMLIGDEERMRAIGNNAVKRSHDFSSEKFYEKIYNLIKE